MERKKVCFKCRIAKPLSDFYAHPQMLDGHLNKCKECAKKDVSAKYGENFENIEYVEKERARAREKYQRLKYKDKYDMKHPEVKCVSRDLKAKGVNLKDREVHHWNYNKGLDVFILGRRAHKLVHKDLTYDEVTKMFINQSTGILLSTKKKHFDYMKKVFEDNNVNYEIDTYELE